MVDAGGEDQKRKIGGYAAVYDQWTEIGNWYREKIAVGAMTAALANSDVRLLYNHDSNHLLAREKSGTLTLREDTKGLYFEAELPEHRHDIAELIERGDLDECSFAFRVRKQEWHWSEGDTMDERVITEISDVVDVTLATYGAYPQTDVGFRSYESAKAEYRSAEEATDTTADDKINQELRERQLALHQHTLTD